LWRSPTGPILASSLETTGEHMRSISLIVWLAIGGSVAGTMACYHVSALESNGGTDADTDAGPDGGSETTCPVHVIGAAGSDTASGNTWAEGLATVEVGLDLAEPLGCDVWVKAGTYFPTEDPDGSTTPDDPRTVTFRLRAGVALYGGFAGDEMDLSDRDIVASETILSGDLGVADDNSDNSYHVVTGADDAAIDGFTIAGGNANDLVEGWPSVEEENGGGMLNDSSSPIVTNCIFWGNSAEYEGGGMANRDGSSPTVTNCTFSGNSAVETGGGMHNDFSSPIVTNCTFSGNSAASHGGGMANWWGAFPIVTNCTFSGNTADEGGGTYTPQNNLEMGYGGATLASSVLWGDTGGEISGDLSNTVVTYSVIQGGFTGEGNIDADPLFVSSSDLHLQPTSPCIDTGSNDAVPSGVTTDLDSNPRIVDGNADDVATVDMGAYEYQP
jgi:hypothetical protein